ncbi:DsrE family protein [Thalassotalea litorea]|uniref:DsrE family protein n=1 Tax=Thalassotalea litorea TaxID=2020715 RepID=UPI0014851AC6|nr:DsrE family protein [Thalassotalea litorea]
MPEFKTGPIIKNYGQNAQIAGALENPSQRNFKIIFDISEDSKSDKVNANYNTVARFINMHVRAGVPLKNLDIAMVIHGKASSEMLTRDLYQARFSKDNVNDELLNDLINAGVDIYVCGQSASYYKIDSSQLKPGINMALSAMTANQLLQQQGYILNPF